jgi:hypothetical protein
MLQEGKDYVLVKTANYIEPGMVIQSGNLVVTRNRVILNVFQTMNVLDQGDDKDMGFIDTLKSIKKDFGELKANMKETFASLKNARHGFEMVKYVAASAPSIEEFEHTVAEIGARNPKSLNLPRSEIKEFKIGFFKGFQIHLNNGTVHKIRTQKLGDLRKMVS